MFRCTREVARVLFARFALQSFKVDKFTGSFASFADLWRLGTIVVDDTSFPLAEGLLCFC